MRQSGTKETTAPEFMVALIPFGVENVPRTQNMGTNSRGLL